MSDDHPYPERYYPEDDPALGVKGLQISDDAKARHYNRYKVAVEFLLAGGISRDKDLVVDVGSGAGYGTEILYQNFARVVGVEVNDEALAYARGRYPTIMFTDIPVVGKAAVFVESIEHMTPAETALFLGPETEVVVVTTPLVDAPDNPYHIRPFSDPDKIFEMMAAHGFPECPRWTLWCNQQFTDGSHGEQFLGLFLRKPAQGPEEDE